LTDEERTELEGLARSTRTEHRTRLKARIVLMAAEGAATRAIGRALGCTTGTASKWRVRYAEHRLAGFSEVGERGATPKYDEETDRRILALLNRKPPEGYANWTGPLVAKALGDVNVQYVWRFLRTHKIDLSGRKSWCVSNDPEFAAKAAEIVGLYMAPPENAIVLAVDEKPSIQALERSQGYLKLPNGRALIGQSHDYKRHGTTTLFAALDLESGKVVGKHYKRRRRVEFLDFMNKVVAAYPDKEIHVVLDNLSTHKPRRDMWLKRHKNVHFHFTPTHASWLNQVEIWFSILSGKSLNGASFQSVPELIAHIEAFIASYNETARPFVWTKSEVHQKRLKPCFAEQSFWVLASFAHHRRRALVHRWTSISCYGVVSPRVRRSRGRLL
jgi:transposase